MHGKFSYFLQNFYHAQAVREDSLLVNFVVMLLTKISILSLSGWILAAILLLSLIVLRRRLAADRVVNPGQQDPPRDGKPTVDDLSTVDDIKVSTFVSRFGEMIERELPNAALTVEDMAAGMGISRIQLYRKIKDGTGMSPVEFLRNARLERSCHLLTATDLTVSEVCYKVGFSSPSYFAKCFRRRYGMLPTVFRDKSGEQNPPAG